MVGGVAVGATAGAAVFAVSRLTGWVLFPLVGASLGAAAPLLTRRFRGMLRMKEVTVRVPQFSDLTFVVDEESRLIAWRLYVEVATRVSTQPLGPEDGLVREALSSLYQLFTTTRETLKASRPSLQNDKGNHSVEHFAIRMLNQQLRPFLAKWHPRLTEFEETHKGQPEATWPLNAQCRAELAAVSANAMDYARAFAELADVKNPETILGAP